MLHFTNLRISYSCLSLSICNSAVKLASAAIMSAIVVSIKGMVSFSSTQSNLTSCHFIHFKSLYVFFVFRCYDPSRINSSCMQCRRLSIWSVNLTLTIPYQNYFFQGVWDVYIKLAEILQEWADYFWPCAQCW